MRRALSSSCSNGVAAPGDQEARAPRSFVALVETQLLEWNPASAGARHALLPAAPLKAVRPLGELGRRPRCASKMGGSARRVTPTDFSEGSAKGVAPP